MPVLGAVLQLSQEPELQRDALDFLNSLSALTLGEPGERGIPVVLESETREQDRDLWEQLGDHPGILFCAVVYADFSDIVLRENHEYSTT